MGLFDKKECSVCGRQFGLLGGSAIADGHLCNDCSRKLSPYLSHVKKMTAADVRKHLEYRENNEKELASFNPDITLGTGRKFYFDNSKGAFILNSKTNFRDGNPDIIPRTQVVNASYTVREDAKEVYKNEETKESFDPKKYDYEYTFNMTVNLNNPYFSEISFNVEDGDKPKLKNGEDYNRVEYTCRMIQHVLCPKLYPEPEKPETAAIPLNAETWTCAYCGQTGNTGKFCSACGKEKAEVWDCPYCGQKGNTGKFCSGCGKEKPSRWFCPNCGQENTGKFCSACGTEMPSNVTRDAGAVKKITPLVPKPGMTNNNK